MLTNHKILALEAAKQYEDVDTQDTIDDDKLSETPKKINQVVDITGISHEDRERIRSGKASIRDIRAESDQIKDQAENLLDFAVGQEKISKKEAKDYKKKLTLTTNKKEREDVLTTIQEAIAQVQTEKDKSEELEKSDPELQKAYRQYDKLIDENAHLLGKIPAEEYKKWIREQKSSIENVEQLTVKFFQSERPPRLETFNKLKSTLKQYGIQSPLDIPYLATEGLSERKNYLKNIQELEKHFDKMGGVKEALYSTRTEKELMKTICEAKNPQEQDRILKEAQKLEKEESSGYTSLETAVGAEKISKKSMDNILDYYKTVDKWDDRFENINLWNNFIESEAKLTGKLQDVFDKEPKNEEGYRLAFKTFRHLDFIGKERFIDEQKRKRDQEIREEDHNKELAITAFKQECTKARQDKIISKKTERNYKDWLEKNAEGKTSKEMKEFLDILTAPEANEKYKNLKAYEKRRNNFQTDLRRLRDVNPTLTEKELKEWEDKYDKEGWKKRETVHDELKLEITKSLEARTKERLEKAGPEALNSKESKETNELSQKNKETAMSAIKALLKFKAYGSAMKRCAELLSNNPYDKDVQALFDEIAKFADNSATEADPDKQKEIYEQYSATADRMMEQDTETKEASDEIQTQEQALEMTRRDQEQRGKLKAHDRSKDDIMEKLKHDDELKDYAKEYMEGADEDEILDDQSLKGKDVVTLDFDTEDSRTDKKALRRTVRAERDKVGDKKGSTIIDFEQAKTGRTLDARSGKEAEAMQRKEKEALAAEMALDIAKIVHPDGEPTPEQLKQAKEAALAKLDKKAKTKIERMSE